MIEITNAITDETAVALGFFDGLHLGHIEVIKEALSFRQYKTAVFTFSDGTLLPKFSKSENILTYEMKCELLSKIGVDYLCAPDFAEVKSLTPKQFVENILVKRLNAKAVSCGYDFKFGKGGAGDPQLLKQLCASFGIEAVVVPAVTVNGQPVSATAIRGLIRKGDIALANRYLGYELSYDLPVVHGAMLGRTIDAPTINQMLPPTNVIPRFGVYKSWTTVDGRSYPSVTNIGIKPTVKDDGIPLIETYIVGYKGNLYGRIVRISLRDFIRPEQKFSSVSELKAQIHKDIEATLSK